MKNTLIIDARQTGKTTRMSKLFVDGMAKNPNRVIMFPTCIMKDNFRNTYGFNNEWLTTAEQFGKIRKGTEVYIEEYFSLPQNTKRNVFTMAKNGAITVYAVGTPVRSYTKAHVLAVREWWKLSGDDLYVDILKDLEEMVQLYGEDLMFSLLVLPKIEIEEPTLNRAKMVSNPKLEIMGDIWA